MSTSLVPSPPLRPSSPHLIFIVCLRSVSKGWRREGSSGIWTTCEYSVVFVCY
ncbi:hypothetical protein E2C01_097325 [Portunus trituberculatus]|uniref:Uncharacterized protein n=1 Tax=Portunus trituberculatus TaxID=210409 RepID=A0A5B7K470_PORTR|nr:hypothetical protein [Portunus trituberculatus]